MPLDVATLKARLGIDPADTSQDVAIAAVAADAQALCEDYCDRQFDLAPDSETFRHHDTTMLLRRWPVDLTTPPVVTDWSGVDVSAFWSVDAALGALFPAYGWYGGPWYYGRTWVDCYQHGPLTVAYTGGFDPWPRGLTWAVTIAFDVLWSETPGGMLEPGPPGQSGNIKKYSVVGAYSVETADAGVGEIGANVGTGWGALPAAVTTALDTYRRESRIGAG
jgi:hypothetical protein